ncbi:MAG: hypothetical protein CGW95_17060 [Phenylobacterium zucineum]|nr:MAG: hypothetical protein CGW95_17060 [Phenylobacterium zucineum]
MSDLPQAENVLAQINLQDERITELEAVAMAKILAKREQYVRQGRFEEAHGAGTAVWIMWLTITEGRSYITNWGDING